MVLAEIFHYIQTRINVDGTKVPKTTDNSYRWNNHPTFKVWLSSAQLQWRYGPISAAHLKGPNKNKNFAKPVVDIAALSWTWLVGELELQSN